VNAAVATQTPTRGLTSDPTPATAWRPTQDDLVTFAAEVNDLLAVAPGARTADERATLRILRPVLARAGYNLVEGAYVAPDVSAGLDDAILARGRAFALAMGATNQAAAKHGHLSAQARAAKSAERRACAEFYQACGDIETARAYLRAMAVAKAAPRPLSAVRAAR
jgi:hypothetical protein